MRKKFWQFRAQANEPPELLLYGDISDVTWWGDEVTPKQFDADLKALGDVSDLTVRINSYGGDVFAGQAIYSMLMRHKARVTVYIDGIAASIASVIAMAGDRVCIPKNAMMMVHNAWTCACGNANDFRKLADDLDKIGESIIAAYQAKTLLKDDEIRAIMDAESWLTAEECVKKGFADEIEDAKAIAASLSGKILTVNGQQFDLSRFRNLPGFPKADISPDDFKGTPFADLPVTRDDWNPNGDSDADIVQEILGPDEDWGAMKKAYLSYAPGEDQGGDPPTQKNAYKLKVARRRSGKLTVYWNQLVSRVAILNGAREGVDISKEAKQEAWDHAMKYYDKFDVPEEERPKPNFALQQAIRNEGRTLSAVNEAKLNQARDLLNEVLDQVKKEPTEGSRAAPPQNKSEEPPEAEQTENGLLSLLQAQAKSNENRRKIL